jgi:phosphate uptake regulator
MEIRRVQITGGSSYVITLPKEWIRTMNIKKNDQLGQTIDRILSASKLSLDIFSKSMGAFFQKDIKASMETIESVVKLELLCEEINAIALKQKGIVAIHVG